MKKEEHQIKALLWFFIITLFLSGAIAIPTETEIGFVLQIIPANTSLAHFFYLIKEGVTKTQEQFPFLFYGYDWLAFAHFALAVLFIGPLRNPVHNKWVIEFGMITCSLIVPFALIAGYFRGIPIWWRFVDCSFGIIGIIPLFICYKKIITLENNITG